MRGVGVIEGGGNERVWGSGSERVGGGGEWEIESV